MVSLPARSASFAPSSPATERVDHDPLRRHADLARVHERAEAGGVGGGLEVGVGEHDLRRLAAQLEQAAREVLGALEGDELADLGGAGEVHAAGRGVRDQLVDDVGGVVGRVDDQVDGAGGQAGVDERADDRGVRARALLGGLQHDGVAVGERGRDRAGAEDHRRVPGRHADDDPRGLADAHGERARHVGGDDLADHGVRLRGGLAQHAGGEVAVEHAPPERAADLLGHDAGDVGRGLHQLVGGGVEERAALARGRGRPAGEGRGGGVDGACGHPRARPRRRRSRRRR